jgi:hypothetical protein
MSQKPWKRRYGLPHRRWEATDALNSDGQPKLDDCDTFGTRAVVTVVGYKNVTYGRRVLEAALEADPPFHRHVIRLDDGREEWATRHNSGRWYGQILREKGHQRRLANLVGVIETVVTEPKDDSGVLHVSKKP